MMNPAEFLWMGLVSGMLMLATVAATGQEVGSAEKAQSLYVAEGVTNSTTSASSRVFKPDHKRLQTQPRYLPMGNTLISPQRTALARPQSITEEVEPQTLPELSPAASLSFEALADN